MAAPKFVYRYQEIKRYGEYRLLRRHDAPTVSVSQSVCTSCLEAIRGDETTACSCCGGLIHTDHRCMSYWRCLDCKAQGEL